MRTVAAFEVRGPAEPAIRGDMARLTACPPRGAIGAGLFLLVSLFLLVAGGAPAAPDSASAGAREAGVFLLDPSVAPASR